MQDTALCFDRHYWACEVFTFVVGVSDEARGAGEVGGGYKIAFLFGSHCDLSVQGSVNGRWSQSNGSFLPVFIWRCWVSAMLVFTFLLFPSVCKEGESSYQIGAQPCAWRKRIVGKKLFLSTWFFAAVSTTKLKNAQFALAVLRSVR